MAWRRRRPQQILEQTTKGELGRGAVDIQAPARHKTCGHGWNTSSLHSDCSDQERFARIAHLLFFPRRAAQRLGGDKCHERGQAVNDKMFATTASDPYIPVAYVQANA
jgi:hypothetical protein